MQLKIKMWVKVIGILLIISAINSVSAIAMDTRGIIMSSFESITGGYQYDEHCYYTGKDDKSYIPDNSRLARLKYIDCDTNKSVGNLTNYFLDFIGLILNLWPLWFITFIGLLIYNRKHRKKESL